MGTTSLPARAALIYGLLASGAWAQSAGLTPAWELKKDLDGLLAHTKRLSSMVEEARPKDWVAAGAPAAYVDQARATRAEIEYLVGTATELAEQPEKMNVALEAFLRINALESMLDSLSQGVRRYQNPALADLMQEVISESNAHQAKLRKYLTELVSTKQEELRVMTTEAQRCRESILRQPGPKKASERKTR